MTLRSLKRRFAVAKEKLAERNALQRYFARKLLPSMQSIGFSILGDHFYEPVPNLSDIRRNYVDEPRQLPGFVATPAWAQNVEEIVQPYIAEYMAGPAYQKYGKKNWFYSGWDAAYYYCLIRSKKPQLITEVGRGLSTWIASIALDQNAAENHPGEIVSIDPYFRGNNETRHARIVTAELQQISYSERTDLLRADIFFADSSHIVKWGSDVLHLFQSWIPGVAPKTLVHVHDIFTPYDYPKNWMIGQKRFWNEQYLFEAFIACNDYFLIECPIFYLAKTGALDRIANQMNCPDLNAASGAAIWLRRVK